MKIIVVSDTHGYNKEFIEKAIDIEKPDMLFHLGDYVEDGLKLSAILGLKSIIVRGNGDFSHPEINEDELVEIKGKKIFLTHGHIYDVRFGINNLYYKGLELDADLVLFGHTHIPVNVIENGIKIMNPGSPYLPRGMNKRKTFGIINIGDNIETEIIELP